MQYISIPSVHASVVNSLREGRSAPASRNMYDAPSPLGDDTRLLESLMAGAMMRSQKTLRELERNSTYRPIKDAMLSYASSPNLGCAHRVVQEAVRGVAPGLCIGKILPDVESISPSSGSTVFYLTHQLSVPKKDLTKKIKGILRYLALVQKKLIVAKSPFAINFAPESISSDLWSNNLQVTFHVEFTVGVIEGSEALLHQSSRAATRMIERLGQGSTKLGIRAELWCGRVASHTNVIETYLGSSMVGFHPLTRSSDAERQISRVPVEGFLEFVNTKVDTLHGDFVDPNTCVLYIDFIVGVLKTLLNHGPYSPFTHSQVS